MTDRLLTLKDVSVLLGLSPQTLYTWRTKGLGPAGFRIGGLVRYRESDLADYLERQRIADRSARPDEPSVVA